MRATDQKTVVIEETVAYSQFSKGGACPPGQAAGLVGERGSKGKLGKSLCCDPVGRNRQSSVNRFRIG